MKKIIIMILLVLSCMLSANSDLEISLDSLKLNFTGMTVEQIEMIQETFRDEEAVFYTKYAELSTYYNVPGRGGDAMITSSQLFPDTMTVYRDIQSGAYATEIVNNSINFKEAFLSLLILIFSVSAILIITIKLQSRFSAWRKSWSMTSEKLKLSAF